MVVFRGPRVATRNGPSTGAPIIDSLANGAIIEGSRSADDPNWLKLRDGRGFVMVEHPRFGRLLCEDGHGHGNGHGHGLLCEAPSGGRLNRRLNKEDEESELTITVPRRSSVRQEKRPSPAPASSQRTARSRPAASPPREAAPRASARAADGSTPLEPTRPTVAPTRWIPDEAALQSGPISSHQVQSGIPDEAARAAGRRARPTDALADSEPPVLGPVLVEVEISAANVQSPKEAC